MVAAAGVALAFAENLATSIVPLPKGHGRVLVWLLVAVLALIAVVSEVRSREHADQGAVPDLPERLRAAAAYVAREGRDSWKRQAKDRKITTPVPAAVAWQWAGPLLAPGPDQVRPALTAPSLSAGRLLTAGVVTRLREQLYDPLGRGQAPIRIVILGGPGAGKTAAMMLLLIDVLDHHPLLPQPRTTTPAIENLPVPVWLTMGGWNPATPLRDWVAATLTRDYPGLASLDYAGPTTASHLLRTGRVALFLDGLDEMPPDQQGPALEAIDRDAQDLPVVLTSRPREYQQALTRGRLHDAAVITLQPAGINDAEPFLLAQQHDPQRQGWLTLIDGLRADPGGVAAQTLTTPLALSLARETYQNSDPTALLDTSAYPTPAALLQHLLRRFLTQAYPTPRERDHALRWLSWIATQLGSSRDIRWWDIPRWTPGTRTAVGLVLGLTLGVSSGLAFECVPPFLQLTVWTRHGWNGRAGLVLSDVAEGSHVPLLCLVIGSAAALWLGRRVGRGFGCAVGLTFGIGLWIGKTIEWWFDSILTDFTYPLMIGFGAGPALGLSLIARPLNSRRSSIKSAAQITITALIVGVAVGGITIADEGTQPWPLDDVIGDGLEAAVAVVIALVAGLMLGAADSPLPRNLGLRLPRRRELRSLVIPAFTGGVGGLCAGANANLGPSVFYSHTGPMMGALKGTVAGMVLGVGFGLLQVWQVPLATIRTAGLYEVYFSDRQRTRAVRLLMWFGLVLGMVFLFSFTPNYGDLLGFIIRAVTVIATGFIGAVVSGFLDRATVGQLRLAQVIWAGKGRPVRFMPLLQTALDRQVLRQAGAVCQFRHAALQDLLADPAAIAELRDFPHSKGPDEISVNPSLAVDVRTDHPGAGRSPGGQSPARHAPQGAAPLERS